VSTSGPDSPAGAPDPLIPSSTAASPRYRTGISSPGHWPRAWSAANIRFCLTSGRGGKIAAFARATDRLMGHRCLQQ
jgi:hypothetical protein